MWACRQYGTVGTVGLADKDKNSMALWACRHWRALGFSRLLLSPRWLWVPWHERLLIFVRAPCALTRQQLLSLGPQGWLQGQTYIVASLRMQASNFSLTSAQLWYRMNLRQARHAAAQVAALPWWPCCPSWLGLLPGSRHTCHAEGSCNGLQIRFWIASSRSPPLPHPALQSCQATA